MFPQKSPSSKNSKFRQKIRFLTKFPPPKNFFMYFMHFYAKKPIFWAIIHLITPFSLGIEKYTRLQLKTSIIHRIMYISFLQITCFSWCYISATTWPLGLKFFLWGRVGIKIIHANFQVPTPSGSMFSRHVKITILAFFLIFHTI